MAEATLKVTYHTTPSIDRVILSLTEKQAAGLKAILGKINGGGGKGMKDTPAEYLRKHVVDELYNVLGREFPFGDSRVHAFTHAVEFQGTASNLFLKGGEQL